MISDEDLMCDYNRRLENKTRKLNKKRYFLNPSTTIKDEKESINFHDNQS